MTVATNALTVAELQAMPEGSRVRDADGDTWEHHPGQDDDGRGAWEVVATTPGEEHRIGLRATSEQIWVSPVVVVATDATPGGHEWVVVFYGAGGSAEHVMFLTSDESPDLVEDNGAVSVVVGDKTLAVANRDAWRFVEVKRMDPDPDDDEGDPFHDPDIDDRPPPF